MHAEGNATAILPVVLAGDIVALMERSRESGVVDLLTRPT